MAKQVEKVEEEVKETKKVEKKVDDKGITHKEAQSGVLVGRGKRKYA